MNPSKKEAQEAINKIKNIAFEQYANACYGKTTKGSAMEIEAQLKANADILQSLIDQMPPDEIKLSELLEWCNETLSKVYIVRENDGFISIRFEDESVELLCIGRTGIILYIDYAWDNVALNWLFKLAMNSTKIIDDLESADNE